MSVGYGDPEWHREAIISRRYPDSQMIRMWGITQADIFRIRAEAAANPQPTATRQDATRTHQTNRMRRRSPTRPPSRYRGERA